MVNNNKTACIERYEQIAPKDLPLSCPKQDQEIWDAHPRVYLPIEETGQVLCPYCGTTYVLQPFPLDIQR